MSQELLQEISKWKLEAADEDSKRYFLHIDEVQSLENGENSIVVGRKGTGKSAICRYFETSNDYNRFCLKLSFKEFPFKLLYALEDKSFTNPSQYISLWKYFIYNSILKLMSQNEAINSVFKEKIQKLHPQDDFTYIGRLMETWTKKSYGAGILSVSGNGSIERQTSNLEEIWPELIPAMESLIVNNIDQSKYYIVFDELDEDYRNYWDDETRTRYISLITSLFKATSNVRRVFADYECKIRPIIFLRDDIYELLSDPDKNKWEDHKIDLVWSKDSLKRMVGFRLARSKDQNAVGHDFDHEWQNAVQKGNFHLSRSRSQNNGSQKSGTPTFDYILALTHARPRDFVRFLRDAARSSIKQGHRQITHDTIRGVDSDFSKYFREELVNEISGVIPDINQLLAYLGATHKQRYNYAVFHKYIEEYQKSEECSDQTKNLTATSIVKILFHFSIVGNAPKKNNRPIYKYQRTYLTVNTSEPLVVHRGLLRTLGLF